MIDEMRYRCGDRQRCSHAQCLTRIARKAGLTVTFFGSTEEYLRASRHCGPNCIVLDPGSDGLDFQSRFAKMNCRTPIVFLTANDNIRMSVRAMKAGAIECFTKPFRDKELLESYLMR
jgi:FixJ family two-component response regulator